MRFSVTSFRRHVSLNRGGSATVGFVTLVAKSAEGVEITLNDLAVRVRKDGQVALTAPKRTYQTERGPRSSSAYRFDDATYQRLIQGISQLAEVAPAIEEALALQQGEGNATQVA